MRFQTSHLALALDVLRHVEVLTVPDDVGEVTDPIAKDNHAGLVRQLKVDLDMTVAVDEVVDVGVILYVLLRVEHQMLALLTHVGRLLAVGTLQA